MKEETKDLQSKNTIMNNISISVPFDDICTLKQAAEFIAFGWEPNNNEYYEPYLHRSRDTEEYTEQMSKAEAILIALYEQNRISMTGFETPGPLPFDPEKQTIQQYEEYAHNMRKCQEFKFSHERKPVERQQRWQLSIDDNWLNNFDNHFHSYCGINIKLQDLKDLQLIKEPTHTYTLRYDSTTREICLLDGILEIHIRTIQGNSKNLHIWKYITQHANQDITREELSKQFENIDCKTDISLIPRNIIENKDILKGCFPILSSSVIHFKPTFTNRDLIKNEQ